MPVEGKEPRGFPPRGFYLVGVSARIKHQPVLLAEVASLVGPGTRVADLTAGGGGHVSAFLEAGANVLAADRDPEAVSGLREQWSGAQVRSLLGAFDDESVLLAVREFEPDVVFLDLGVSSHQLDEDRRGFTFRSGAPLDMRMGTSGSTATDLLANASVDELRHIFRAYGDERRAGALAREIDRRRQRQALTTSDDLVNAIRAVLGPRSGPADFARLFQAVRIAVNRELEALERALPALRDLLRAEGRLAVISYHSGEDRVVKHQFREWSRRCVCPPTQPICTCRGRPLGRVVTRKPITPGPAELADNPRARSAKLRVFQVAAT